VKLAAEALQKLGVPAALQAIPVPPQLGKSVA
jgi:hypothetical protein